MLVCQCHPFLSVFLANGLLLRVLRQSSLLAKIDNEVRPVPVQQITWHLLTTKENPENPQL